MRRIIVAVRFTPNFQLVTEERAQADWLQLAGLLEASARVRKNAREDRPQPKYSAQRLCGDIDSLRGVTETVGGAALNAQHDGAPCIRRAWPHS